MGPQKKIKVSLVFKYEYFGTSEMSWEGMSKPSQLPIKLNALLCIQLCRTKTFYTVIYINGIFVELKTYN